VAIGQSTQTSTPAAALSTHLLLVDDDVKLCRLVREYLEPLGYQVSSAHTGPDGLELALAVSYDAIILDVMLPGLDGFEILKRLRAKSNVPVLMLTGLGDEADRIVGLEIGADDYLPKTFSTRELLARLRAVIRRSRITALKTGDAQQPPVVVGDLHIDPETRVALRDTQPLTLTAVEFDLLLSLARACGRVKTRERLLLEVAERDFEAFDRSIDVHISSIRKKLGDDPKTPRFIQTIRGVGYMMLRP
jgi:DNA-binding response OmpR family regulator